MTAPSPPLTMDRNTTAPPNGDVHAQPNRRRPGPRLRAADRHRRPRCPARHRFHPRGQPHLARRPRRRGRGTAAPRDRAGHPGHRRTVARTAARSGAAPRGAHRRPPRHLQGRGLPGRRRRGPRLGPQRAALRRGRAADAPRRGESAPGPFRSGLARLAAATGAPVVPVGQAGSRRLCSGSSAKQLAGVFTAPLRRPCLHVHIGSPVHLPDRVPEATHQAREAVTAAWRTAASAAGEACAAV